MSKLLLITQYFPPDIGGATTRVYTFFRELKEKGKVILTPYRSPQNKRFFIVNSKIFSYLFPLYQQPYQIVHLTRKTNIL